MEPESGKRTAYRYRSKRGARNRQQGAAATAAAAAKRKMRPGQPKSWAAGIAGPTSVSWKTAVTSRDPGAGVKMAVIKTSLRKSAQALPCSRNEATPCKKAQGVAKRRGPVTPQRRGPVTPQRRGPVTPQRRGPVTPQRRGPVTPQRRGPVTPQRRGPVTPQRRGPVTSRRRVPVTPQKRGLVTPQMRRVATPQNRVTATPLKRAQAVQPRRRRKVHPSGFRGRGQLKLSVTPENGLFIIHIMEARGLMGKEYRACDSYVKVVIIPDSENKNRQKTKTVPDCKSPVFHETFVFAIGIEDHQKRLLVTVWNRNRTSRQSEFLGCMSFGVRSLSTAAKEVTGWYYLLGEDLGRTKHLKVASRRLKHTSEAAPSSHGAALEVASPENMQCLTVTILRGKDGYGFTICSDSPVRVQAVDPDGPADRAGLQQLDTVLQLNGQPVEQWKCVDLAHAIRNCHSEITVVVWRTVPMVKPGFEGLIHRPTYKPSGHTLPSPPCKKREKTPTGPRQSRRLLVNGTDGGGGGGGGGGGDGMRGPLGSDESSCKARTQTLRGTRVTSSSGDNYIILAPINPGSQILRPVYQDNHGTLGRLYHPRPLSEIHQDDAPAKGGGNQGRSTFLRRSATTKASKESPSAGYQQNFANYQNCTVVHSHLPHSTYGTYVQLAPKILIFPIFVQPLDLCSPSRTLVLSEEMILHESKHLSVKVTVFIYTDLVLLTREDEPGRCNVLQNPLYMHKLRLQDDPTEDLRFNIIHTTEASDCVLSLETYSLDQRRRVCQCLSDSIEKRRQEPESPAATEQSPRVLPCSALERDAAGSLPGYRFSLSVT
ncbi:hypothetical protein SKAU_G00005190 [Synaphobranchus kaupii]|uniref:Regulator of G-protein signaling 3 n=1 Tax=Synaphobranchus kaupii TaxID=118154 RepID=A0A9Q1G8Z4_SYNKA|nr:hypothetical protein SKAU_G00005190 [Synaphobranchus kaupii]